MNQAKPLKEVCKKAKNFFLTRSEDLKEPWKKWYYLHSKYVGIAAQEISPESSEKLFEIVGWLHDVAKIKKEENHAIESAKIAKRLLKKDLSQKNLHLLIDCIKNHSSSSKPLTKEGKIIQSADKVAIFYPEVQRFVKKIDGKDKLQKTLNEHYSKIKLKKAKKIALKFWNNKK